MLSTLFLLASGISLAAAVPTTPCRCMPTDRCWPNKKAWDKFNGTVDGRLVATTPIASVCHDPTYEGGQCEFLQDNWIQPYTHDKSSSSIMAAAVGNGTCDPYTPQESPCTLGNLVVYSVDILTPEHISKTIAFAKKQNIRLNIRNTGHDYSGKSTGAGSLSIWTHHLKEIKTQDYKSESYSGPAVKLGAGVQVAEGYEALEKENAIILSGSCVTVGVVGGFTLGGGHSQLSSEYGLGSDVALEYEVIDGNGKLLKATREKNSDLYWALSGGGGGTFGVVYSLIVKRFPSTPVTAARLTILAPKDGRDKFYQAIESFHANVGAWTADGASAGTLITNTTFAVGPILFKDKGVEEVTKKIQPWLDELDKIGIPYKPLVKEWPTFLAFYNEIIRPSISNEVANAQYGGHFIPNSVVEENNQGLTAAIKTIVDDGTAVWVGFAVNASEARVGKTWNSAHPSWRDASMSALLVTSWNSTAPPGQNNFLANKMTTTWVPALKALAPDAGAYMSEADPNEPNFQTEFYGPYYERLSSIKKRYDPDDIFYAVTGVGSDRWKVGANGALCMAGGR